ncbi:hypothetical protein CYMTET_35658 [Cymbomonas tetramitiformis]|uniref:Uncharacterized protein n=1 Tax=Cymbomonas tetramitiformis TaxID=36881 RepID=A0AAE0KNX6_9CHLO|nr:hypothetical protein CYMTET_35658 [Cymbomonas tetramitiformis]
MNDVNDVDDDSDFAKAYARTEVDTLDTELTKKLEAVDDDVDALASELDDFDARIDEMNQSVVELRSELSECHCDAPHPPPPPPPASSGGGSTPSSTDTQPISPYYNFIVYNRMNARDGTLTKGMPLGYWVKYDYWWDLYPFTKTRDLSPCENETAAQQRFSDISQIVLQERSINLYDSACMLSALGILYADANEGAREAREYGEQWIGYLLNLDQSFPAFSEVSREKDHSNGLYSIPVQDRNIPFTDANWMYGNTRSSVSPRYAYYYREVMERYHTDAIPNEWCAVYQSQDETWKNYGNPRCGEEEWHKYNSVDDAHASNNQLVYIYDDYRPVTGEHVWGKILGPLIFDEYVGTGKGMEVAMNGIVSLRLMMTALKNASDANKTGHVVYYQVAPGHCVDGDAADDCERASTWSTENLASTIASVRRMHHMVGEDTVLSAYVHENITFGGTGNPSSTLLKPWLDEMQQNLTNGFINFCYLEELTVAANVNGGTSGDEIACSPCVTQGGNVHNTDFSSVSSVDEAHAYDLEGHNTLAVDVFTWGLSVLAADIAEAKGLAAPWKLWTQVRQYGGYNYTKIDGSHETLYGVGYTYPNDDVVSGEWTLGAVFAVRSMYYNVYQKCGCTHDCAYDVEVVYSTTGKTYDRASFCAMVIEELKRDEANMLSTLYGDELYVTVPDMGATSINNGHKVNKTMTAVNYANRKGYDIPFGWKAEQMPSMASTTWMLFQERGFNPMDMRTPYQPSLQDD